jgi:Cys-tRNA(Pro)/Cys-tRNA(Cys) deacylase
LKKTNAARILEQKKIDYKIITYTIDKSDLSALHVASDTGQDIKRIFKTLVVTDEKNRPLVACIAGDEELDLKALARVAKCKKCTMLPMKDLLKITGYVRGGCSPIGMKKQYLTFMDESARGYENIFISAGVRGEQIQIDPNDLKISFSVRFEKLIKF